jgi:hypothetical protein
MKFILMLITLLIVACSPPKLGIQQHDVNTRGGIKTQGFYYNMPEYLSFMFYTNGVIFGGFFSSTRNIDTLTRIYSDTLLNNQKNYLIPDEWGLFEIKEDRKIKIEKWYTKGWGDYGITKIPGYILNDTTLLLDHPSIGRDTFYFHYLPVKPDSTNRFIKPSLKE